jgi:hypothetical protein
MKARPDRACLIRPRFITSSFKAYFNFPLRTESIGSFLYMYLHEIRPESAEEELQIPSKPRLVGRWNYMIYSIHHRRRAT